MSLNINQIMRYEDLFIQGAQITIFLTLISAIIGTLIATGGAYVLNNGTAVSKFFVRTYVEIIRNTPALIQIFIIFFVLPHIGLRLEPINAAVLALSLYFCAYAIEIIRSGLKAIPKNEIEAAYCLGLTHLQVFRHVVFIQMFRVIYPAYSSQFILLLLGSSLASQVSVEELFHVAGFVDSRTYRSFEVYTIICIIYIAMTLFFKTFFYVIGRYAFRWPIQ